jgi:hypothetical protein
MGSPPGNEHALWYQTPERQIALCFCGIIHADLKQRFGKVEEGKFWKLLLHHIPFLEELFPKKFLDTIVNRAKNRGDKLNRYKTEHPTHPSKQNSTGLYWDWANERYTSCKREFTLTKEEMRLVILRFAKKPELQSDVLKKPQPEPMVFEDYSEDIEVHILRTIKELNEVLRLIRMSRAAQNEPIPDYILKDLRELERKS